MIKKKLSLLVVILFSLNCFSQNVGIGTTTPNASAQLEISSSNKGFLPPRVALQGLDISSPVTTPAAGLLVYNTATAGIVPNNVSPGYYYWNGAVWYPVNTKGNAYGDMQYWDGNKWVILPVGAEGEHLIVCNGRPQWGSCIKTLTISPQNNPDEVYISSYTPTSSTSGISQLTIAGWTAGGSPYYWRAFLKFDMSTIPANAIIQSAKLSLYSTPNPVQGNGVDAQFGSANACYIQRVTSNWSTGTISWNSQPTTSTTNQVTIPQSVSSFQDNVDMDVTNLIKDIITTNNYGVEIRLQTESYYNARQYASSFNTNIAKHPTLVVTYSLP